MKFKLFILTNHVLHISILYPFQFSSRLSLFLFLFLPSLIFTLTCGKGSDPTKTAGSAHNHLLPIFERKETFFALNYPLGWQSIPSLSVEHIFPSCIHIHGTINKITIGKQKRMTRGNLIPASNYSSSQTLKNAKKLQEQRCMLA